MMQPRAFAIYDVFSERRLAGNQLAVVFDAEGLSGDHMQAIAREFNLSETAFVLPVSDARHRARLRIFTPGHELPFAGHPTIGSAIALAERAGDPSPSLFALEEGVGPVRCVVTREGEAAFAEFDLAMLPEELPLPVEGAAVGAALGLAPQDIGFENHRVSHWTAGVAYVCVPVASLAAAAQATFDTRAWLELGFPIDVGNGQPPSAYIYCRDTIANDAAFHARMFVPDTPWWEDSATGSAAAAFAGAVGRFDAPVDGRHDLWIEQGIEIGRPSRLRLGLGVKGGRIDAARIGGYAVKVADGRLFV
jgi:trans-2,3-dihydro-3-hydroxyanthranilate isomerase